MTKVELRTATAEDAATLAPLMREADALEVWRSGRFSPERALADSIALSDGRCSVAYFNDQPVAVFGIVHAHELVAPVAVPWLLTLRGVEKYPKTFLTVGREIVGLMQTEAAILMQTVDAEYTSAIRFLRALGFVIGPAVPHGPDGHLFRTATRSHHV